jgi:hypothetical protein
MIIIPINTVCIRVFPCCGGCCRIFAVYRTTGGEHLNNNAAVVIRDYISAYPDPIVIKKDSTAFISHCDLEYRGWVWIALASGKAGWAPQQIFTPLSANEVVCLEDYTAHELSVRSGEQITVMKSLNSWYWALNDSGESGWVPEECVSMPGI